MCFQPYLLSCFESLEWKLLLGLCWNMAILQGLEEFAGVWFPQKANKVAAFTHLWLSPYYISKNWKGSLCGNMAPLSSHLLGQPEPWPSCSSLRRDSPAQWEWGHRMLKASLLSGLAFSSPARGQQYRVNCFMVPHSQRTYLERSEKNQA